MKILSKNIKLLTLVCLLAAGMQSMAVAAPLEKGEISIRPIQVGVRFAKPSRAYIDNKSRPAYKNAWGVSFEVGYAVSENIELFSRLGYYFLKGNSVFMTKNKKFNFKNNYMIPVDVGSRYYFDVTGPIVPYVGGSLGVTLGDNEKADVYQGNNLLGRAKYHASHSPFRAGLQVGADWRATSSISFGLRTGLDFNFNSSKGAGRGAGKGTFVVANPARISVPVTANMRIRVM
jgi:outer membrane protein with beta-barrel domain